MKIVINTCYGGFGLSFAGLKRYYEIKFPEKKLYLYNRDFSTDTYTKVDENQYDDFRTNIFDKDFGSTFKGNDLDARIFNDHFVFTDDLKRTDPILIQVVEELGEKASEIGSKLEVVEFSGNKYRIREYDGMEWLETPDSIQWEKV